MERELHDYTTLKNMCKCKNPSNTETWRLTLRLRVQTVGRMVRVWCEGQSKWFEGMVISFDASEDLEDSHGSLFLFKL
jgi:hypothetical protein